MSTTQGLACDPYSQYYQNLQAQGMSAGQAVISAGGLGSISSTTTAINTATWQATTAYYPGQTVAVAPSNRMRKFMRLNEIEVWDPHSKRWEEPLDELRFSISEWLGKS